MSSFSNSLKYITSSPAIRSMTSHSTFRMDDLFNGKTATFLLTHDEKSTYYPLVTIFFKQMYEVGIRVTRQSAKGKLDVPMNFIIDEMGMMPAIKDIQNMYGAARSRNIRINAFIQSLEQLELKYGKQITKVIEDNSSNHIFLGAGTEETQRRFQSKAGNRLVWNSATKRYDEVPLIRKEELNLIAKGHSLIISIERYPFLSKLPMVTQYSYWRKEWLSDINMDHRDEKIIHKQVNFYVHEEENVYDKLFDKLKSKETSNTVSLTQENIAEDSDSKNKTKDELKPKNNKGVHHNQQNADDVLFEDDIELENEQLF